MKNQTVRRVLQDNKVPGTSAGTRAAAGPSLAPTGSAARFLRESQVGLCEGPCRADWFSKRKAETPLRKLQGSVSQQSPERLNSVGELNYPEEILRVLSI